MAGYIIPLRFDIMFRLPVLCLLALTLCAGDDPFAGTWKLDSDKSKFKLGAPKIMFGAIQIETGNGFLKSTASGSDNEGFVSDFTFNCALDGTPCSVVAATPMKGAWAVDTIALKRINDRTINATGTKDGKLVYVDTRTVSADGATLTVQRNGTTPDGKKYESTLVLIKTR